MSAIKKGIPWSYRGQFIEWTRRGHSDRGTVESGVVMEGLTVLEANGLFQALKSGYDRVRMDGTGDGPGYRVIATLNGDDQSDDQSEQIIDTHEILPSEYPQPAVASPVLVSHFTSGEEAIAFVTKLSNKIRDGGTDYATAVQDIADAPVSIFAHAGEQEKGVDLLNTLIAGNDVFTDSRAVYRHTFNVPLDAIYFPNRLNINCVFLDTDELLNMEGINLPNNFSLGEGQWLKKEPTGTAQYGGGVLWTYDYVRADDWNYLLYNAATL